MFEDGRLLCFFQRTRKRLYASLNYMYKIKGVEVAGCDFIRTGDCSEIHVRYVF
jgi:hypothetical protein